MTTVMNTASSLKSVDIIKRLDNYVVGRRLELSCVRIISRFSTCLRFECGRRPAVGVHMCRSCVGCSSVIHCDNRWLNWN